MFKAKLALEVQQQSFQAFYWSIFIYSGYHIGSNIQISNLEILIRYPNSQILSLRSYSMYNAGQKGWGRAAFLLEGG